MRNRLIVYLSSEEWAALDTIAKEEVRPLEAQLRFLLVSEAARRGIFPPVVSELVLHKILSANNKIAATLQGEHDDFVTA